MPLDEKSELIVQNRMSGGRGKKRSLMTATDTVSVSEHMGIDNDKPFMNERKFRAFVRPLSP